MSKLYRSRTDRKITGLCGGLAEMLGMDSTLLRLLVVITALFSGGVVIAIYVLAALVIPNEPWTGGPFPGGCWKDWKRAEKHYRKAQKYGWNDGYAGYAANEAPYAAQANNAGGELDDMMKDIEKKALRKEIDELREKVAQYEKELKQYKGEI